MTVKAIAACIFLALICFSAAAQQPTSILSVEDAKNLVLAALPPRTKHLQRFALEQYESPQSPQFYFFTGVWDNPHGSVATGNYAVDKMTADVWNAPAACVELSSPELRKLQAQIRSRNGMSPAQYRRKKRTCPLELQDEASASKQ